MGTERNELYPVFLKMHQLNMLLVGGGVVAEEKLHFLLKSSPRSGVHIVASAVSDAVRTIAEGHPAIRITVRPYRSSDLDGTDLVIAATNDRAVNEIIRNDAKKRHLLVNVADTPDLCDFYLGGIVTKGDLKVAISTNGKSPTFAKRFRQVLEESLPDSIPEMLQNLRTIRDRLKGDFGAKVDKLNEITAVLTRRS